MMSAPRSNNADPRIGANTSDHTYQSARFVLIDSQDKPLLAIQGCTWNLMNYGISLKTNGTHTNNPWDFDEDHTAYMTRKQRQLDKMIAIINGGSYDFFLLQEVDIFFPANRKINVTEQEQKERDLLVAQFQDKLRELGWEMIVKSGSKKQQALVTLFNTKNLQIKDVPLGVFPTTSKQCRGMSQEFLHKTSQRSVTMVNLHLDYDADYSQVIPDFQNQQIQNGKFTIMGGDTNHAPNQNIVGLINNWNNITNIAGIESGISHHHKNSPIIKCYDGFFANPTQDTAVQITALAAEVFKVHEQTGTYIVEALPANPHVHRSAPGQPWRRGGYNEFLHEKSATSTNNVAPLFGTPPAAPTPVATEKTEEKKSTPGLNS